MEKSNDSRGEIEEEQTLINHDHHQEEVSSPLNPNPKSVKTKVPEVEVQLFRRGKGPIDVFRSKLGGWDQDQLEVRDILDKFGFKSVYALDLDSTRGAPIRFNQKNGRSLIPYTDGAVIRMDGEPKDSLIKPVTRGLVCLAFISLLITIACKESSGLMKKFPVLKKFDSQGLLLGFVVIIFSRFMLVSTRRRKRTGYFLKRFGW